MNRSWVPIQARPKRGRHIAASPSRSLLAIATAVVSLFGVISVVVSGDETIPVTITVPSIPSTPRATELEVGERKASRPAVLFSFSGSAVPEVAVAPREAVEGVPKSIAFVLNEDGLVVAVGDAAEVAEPTLPQAPTSVATPSTTDHGKPRLWLDSFSASAVASAAVPSDGVVVVDLPQPEDARACYLEARQFDLAGLEQNAVARMISQLFTCMATVNGLGEREPSSTRRWDGAAKWGFEHLAEQVGAEAVVVSYCESLGFSRSAVRGNNLFGYGGLFQMGSSEMRRFGGSGLSKFDPVDNAYAAANYFLYQYRAGAGWGGWSPWAVVNTNFDDDINNQVVIPILPRFGSTDESYRGRHGPELPDWAVDPWAYEVPSWGGCPFTGGRWPTARKLDQ